MSNAEHQIAAFEALGKVVFDLKDELYFKKIEVDRLTATVARLEKAIAAKKGESEA